MKRLVLFVLIFFIFFSKAGISSAIEDPRLMSNNKFGVHILFTSEINNAARLVNSNGGDWGYVTIPIQAGDRDLEKWQKFMDLAKQNHVIPIVRLATEGDYFDTKVWRKPTENDVLDFANFLNSLNWPVKNRYVIIFNEVNRGDEWGGVPAPGEYARMLSYAIEIFKSKNNDFFIISAGLDNASANIQNQSFNQYDFMAQMGMEVPEIFNKIDGLGSHSYPNPAFSQAPWITTDKNVSSFDYEKKLVFNLSGKDLPVFITETGWSSRNVSEQRIAEYFTYAFVSVWSNSDIVAVTPFLLQAGTEPFLQFTLIKENGDYNDVSLAIKNIAKIKGQPTVNHNIGVISDIVPDKYNIPVKKFSQKIQYEGPPRERTKTITAFLKWLLKLSV